MFDLDYSGPDRATIRLSDVQKITGAELVYNMVEFGTSPSVLFPNSVPQCHGRRTSKRRIVKMSFYQHSVCLNSCISCNIWSVLRCPILKILFFLSLMLSNCSFTMLLCELPWLKKIMLLIVMVAMVTRTVSLCLNLSNFVCMISSEILMIETWDKFFLVTQDNV